MSIGERIKELRLQQEISQTELAERINVSKQTLYKYETGIVTNIPSDKVEALATALNTTPAYLMGWDDTIKNKNEDSSDVKTGKERQLNSEEDFDEIITLRRAMKKMEPEERKRSVDLLKLAFKEAFNDNDDK